MFLCSQLVLQTVSGLRNLLEKSLVLFPENLHLLQTSFHPGFENFCLFLDRGVSFVHQLAVFSQFFNQTLL